MMQWHRQRKPRGLGPQSQNIVTNRYQILRNIIKTVATRFHIRIKAITAQNSISAGAAPAPQTQTQLGHSTPPKRLAGIRKVLLLTGGNGEEKGEKEKEKAQKNEREGDK